MIATPDPLTAQAPDSENVGRWRGLHRDFCKSGDSLGRLAVISYGGNGMADLAENNRVVRAFYEEAFNDGDPEGAVQRYIGDRYVQHNPQAADGTDAFIGFVQWYRGQFPQLHVDIKRMIAEGDLVVTHSRITTSPEDRGTAAVDIFRVENGKVVEHWDVLQPIPAEAANTNTMF
jgi:predicted SnoaL-like aldol condensation-catalyzing enzyme